MDTRIPFKACPEYLQRVHGLRYTLNTLRRYHCEGIGPKFHHVGGRLFAWASALDSWVLARTRDQMAALPQLPAHVMNTLDEWRARGLRWRWVTWCRPCDNTIWMVPQVISRDG